MAGTVCILVALLLTGGALFCPMPLPVGPHRVYCSPVCKRFFILGGVPLWERGDFSIRATRWPLD